MRQIVLVLVVVLLVGCARSGKDFDSENTQQYRTGSQGLDMRFAKNSPPTTVFDGDEVEVAVELRNRGAYPRGVDNFQGKLVITGFDPRALQGGQWVEGSGNIDLRLEGRSAFNPEGGFDVKIFRGVARVPLDGERYEATLQVHSCYEYKTIAEASVCVDPTPNELLERNEVCDHRGAVKIPGSQGGPVAVSKVLAEHSKDFVNVRIWVKNVGNGIVLVPGKVNTINCPLGLHFTEVDKVTVEADMPFDGAPVCSPEGGLADPVRLGENGEGFIFCRFRLPGDLAAFYSPLQIRLGYGYSGFVKTQMTIVNPEATAS